MTDTTHPIDASALAEEVTKLRERVAELEAALPKPAPDCWVITAIANDAARDAGKRFWLNWSEESGGWWGWGPEAWACRFQDRDGARFKDAMLVAPTSGPYWAKPDPDTIEVRQYNAPRPVAIAKETTDV
jgi:hypothetical protein